MTIFETTEKYRPFINENVDGSVYAFCVRLDRDWDGHVEEKVVQGYKGRHFANRKNAEKSINAFIAKQGLDESRFTYTREESHQILEAKCQIVERAAEALREQAFEIINFGDMCLDLSERQRGTAMELVAIFLDYHGEAVIGMDAGEVIDRVLA